MKTRLRMRRKNKVSSCSPFAPIAFHFIVSFPFLSTSKVRAGVLGLQRSLIYRVGIFKRKASAKRTCTF